MITSFQPRKGFKLSTIISFVVAASVLFAIIINATISYRAEKKSLFNNTLELNRIAAGDLSKTAESLINSMQSSLKVAAEYFADTELTDEHVASQLDFFMGTNRYFNSVAVVNTTGTVVSTSPNTLGLIGEKLTTEGAEMSLKLKAPFISQPYVATTKRIIVLISHPIFSSSGVYKGFVAGSIYLQQPNILQDILGQQASNKSGSYFFVVDASGKLIYHPDTNRISENTSMNPVVQKVIDGQAGEQHVINSKGVSYLAGYSPVPTAGWGIVSQTPENYVAATSIQLLKKMLGVSAPFLLVLFIFTFWLSRKLAEPLNRLANYASLLLRNDDKLLPLPPKVYWNYEANQLNNTVAVAFNKLREKTAELSQEAQTDSLTGLTNRRTLDAITSLWHRQGVPFSVVMLDLDHFKCVNDRFGHQMGDGVLQLLAGIMLSMKRDGDYCCRYGGEEFTLLLPFTSELEAFRLAEQIRIAMASSTPSINEQVTLSAGVAVYDTRGDVSTLFKSADEALYRAKHQGRNRTVMFSEMANTIKQEA